MTTREKQEKRRREQEKEEKKRRELEAAKNVQTGRSPCSLKKNTSGFIKRLFGRDEPHEVDMEELHRSIKEISNNQKYLSEVPQIAQTVEKINVAITSLNTAIATLANSGNAQSTLENQLSEERERSLETVEKFAKLQVQFDKLCLGAEELKNMLGNEHQLRMDAEMKVAKAEAETREAYALTYDTPSEFLPINNLNVFGLTRKNADDGIRKECFTALRALCNFTDWSKEGEPGAFVNQFGKVDAELLALRGLEDFEAIRARVSAEVGGKISENLKALFNVSWDMAGKPFNVAEHWAPSSGGATVIFVKSALITRDGAVLKRAEVECK